MTRLKFPLKTEIIVLVVSPLDINIDDKVTFSTRLPRRKISVLLAGNYGPTFFSSPSAIRVGVLSSLKEESHD